MRNSLRHFEERLSSLVDLALICSKIMEYRLYIEEDEIPASFSAKKRNKHNEVFFSRNFNSEDFSELVRSEYREFAAKSIIVQATSLLERFFEDVFKESYARSDSMLHRSTKEVKFSIGQLNNYRSITEIRSEILKRELTEYMSLSLRDKLERLKKYIGLNYDTLLWRRVIKHHDVRNLIIHNNTLRDDSYRKRYPSPRGKIKVNFGTCVEVISDYLDAARELYSLVENIEIIDRTIEGNNSIYVVRFTESAGFTERDIFEAILVADKIFYPKDMIAKHYLSGSVHSIMFEGPYLAVYALSRKFHSLRNKNLIGGFRFGFVREITENRAILPLSELKSLSDSLSGDQSEDVKHIIKKYGLSTPAAKKLYLRLRRLPSIDEIDRFRSLMTSIYLHPDTIDVLSMEIDAKGFKMYNIVTCAKVEEIKLLLDLNRTPLPMTSKRDLKNLN